MGWKRISGHRVFQKGAHLLRAGSRDNEGANKCRWLERACAFRGLVADFYSLKTKKIPAGRLALGYWIGHYRVTTRMGIFA